MMIDPTMMAMTMSRTHNADGGAALQRSPTTNNCPSDGHDDGERGRSSRKQLETIHLPLLDARSTFFSSTSSSSLPPPATDDRMRNESRQHKQRSMHAHALPFRPVLKVPREHGDRDRHYRGIPIMPCVSKTSPKHVWFDLGAAGDEGTISSGGNGDSGNATTPSNDTNPQVGCQPLHANREASSMKNDRWLSREEALQLKQRAKQLAATYRRQWKQGMPSSCQGSSVDHGPSHRDMILKYMEQHLAAWEICKSCDGKQQPVGKHQPDTPQTRGMISSPSLLDRTDATDQARGLELYIFPEAHAAVPSAHVRNVLMLQDRIPPHLTASQRTQLLACASRRLSRPTKRMARYVGICDQAAAADA